MKLINDTVLEIDSGIYHSVMLMKSGKIFTFSNNFRAKIGRYTAISYDQTPAEVNTVNIPVGQKVVAISSSSYHCLCLTDEGLVFA
jgi:alpha-tubulin suppressor-like RCC1 family protein